MVRTSRMVSEAAGALVLVGAARLRPDPLVVVRRHSTSMWEPHGSAPHLPTARRCTYNCYVDVALAMCVRAS